MKKFVIIGVIFITFFGCMSTQQNNLEELNLEIERQERNTAQETEKQERVAALGIVKQENETVTEVERQGRDTALERQNQTQSNRQDQLNAREERVSNQINTSYMVLVLTSNNNMNNTVSNPTFLIDGRLFQNAGVYSLPLSISVGQQGINYGKILFSFSGQLNAVTSDSHLEARVYINGLLIKTAISRGNYSIVSISDMI